MPLFGKKPASQAPPLIPVDQVLNMRAQGLSNDQTIQALQRDGYASDQIFDAMSQADIKGSVEAARPYQMPPLENPMSQEMQMPQQEFMQQPQMQAATDVERIEELAEAIIDEKWNELVKNINKVIEWKTKTEARINKSEQAIDDLRNNLNTIHQTIIGKVEEYDKNIQNVGAEVKAMDKVFQKVLPQLTESIGELSRLTDKAKEKSTKK
ncbi:MAG: hypothetical protein Q7J54_00725 [Candidatus Woesearchaeota archaeon]|nr:hypothetical protein [Candidatus Woesearchaeota archaeon]